MTGKMHKKNDEYVNVSKKINVCIYIANNTL